MTEEVLASLRAEVLGRPIRYGGDDAGGFEERFKTFAPASLAYDLRKMMQRFQIEGMLAESGDVARRERMLARPLRTFRAFAQGDGDGLGGHSSVSVIGHDKHPLDHVAVTRCRKSVNRSR